MMAALLQKLLALLQCGAKAKAQAQQSAAGGIAPPGEDLVQIDLAHPGQAGQHRFGHLPLLHKLFQQLTHTLPREVILIFG